MKTSGVAETNRRILRDVLLGAGFTAIVAALVWHFYPGFWQQPAVEAHETALQRRQALQEAMQQQAPRATVAAVQPAEPPALCELGPLIPPADAQDGQAVVEHPFPGGPRIRARAFLRQAEAAAARGRQRDAEVALLAAGCESDKASARPTLPLARLLALLGDRYVAAAGTDDPLLREQLAARARQLLELSARTYASALGPNAARSREARQRVAMLDQELVAAEHGQQPAAQPNEPADEPVRKVAENKVQVAPVVAVRRADPAPAPAAPAAPKAVPRYVAQPPQPLPDAGGLASAPEVRQLAADLARLRAQAEAVSPDAAGLQRRAELARVQRDACRSTDCLRAWYAKRRRELLAEF